MNLTEFSKEVHKDNVEKGFYEDWIKLQKVIDAGENIRDTTGLDKIAEIMFVDQRLALIMSEAGEAVEANRKGRFAKLSEFEEHVNELGRIKSEGDEYVFKSGFIHFIKDTLEDEIADTIIRLLDLSGYMKIDIQRHIDLKLKYNKLRAYKHGKKY